MAAITEEELMTEFSDFGVEVDDLMIIEKCMLLCINYL